jgi:hypothetical protein
MTPDIITIAVGVALGLALLFVWPISLPAGLGALAAWAAGYEWWHGAVVGGLAGAFGYAWLAGAWPDRRS